MELGGVYSKYGLIALVLVAVFATGIESALAQCTSGSPTCTLVTGSGGEQDIDKFGICRKITNNNSTNIMVPHNNANEWCGTTSGCTGGSSAISFIQNLPSNVTSGTCGASGTWQSTGTCMLGGMLHMCVGGGPYSFNGCGTVPTDPTGETCSPLMDTCNAHIAPGGVDYEIFQCW
jgi:hypothetical protein